MSASVEIINWVQKKPVILFRFDEVDSESLCNSLQGFEHLTIIKRHCIIQDFKLPTICLLEVQEENGPKCYLATATRKGAVGTFDSRITIKKMRPVFPTSLQDITALISGSRMKHLIEKRLPDEGGIIHLSSKLSANLIEILAANPDNQSALETASSLLPSIRRPSHIAWAQEDAIQMAMAAFGIRSNAVPNQIVLKRGTSSGLGCIGTYLYEDKVTDYDALHLPGFDTISSDVTGRAVFRDAMSS